MGQGSTVFESETQKPKTLVRLVASVTERSPFRVQEGRGGSQNGHRTAATASEARDARLYTTPAPASGTSGPDVCRMQDG